MKILIVDDELTNRLILKAMLEKDGHEVIVAEDGQQAIDLFKETHPDIILMDVMMPKVDGYEATRTIKSLCEDRFVPIIFLTAITDENALVECIDSGGDDFLTKPYNRTILKAKIQALDRIKGLYSTIKQQKDDLAERDTYIRREHEVAKQIFSNIMNSGELDTPGIRSLHNSADTFNGDIMLVSCDNFGKIHFLVGDFTGHGLAAAIGALPTAQIFYHMSAQGSKIEDIVLEINSQMKNLLPTGMFLAVCIGQVNIEAKTLDAFNAGLPEAIIQSGKSGEITHRIVSKHVALGVVDLQMQEIIVESVELSDGDKVIVYTDGIIETTHNTSGEMFGGHRLEEAIINYPLTDGLVEYLGDALQEFRGDGLQEDDLTLFEFTYDSALLNEVKKIESA